MKGFLQVLLLGRRKIAGFALVAVLVSLGTATSLIEPWIYRAIIDDVAGVFVQPTPLAHIEGFVKSLGHSKEHLSPSSRQIFRAPLKKTPPEAPHRKLHP